MLIFIGGVETLRPSIERFVEKAKAEGVDLQVHLKEGKAHDYALIRDIAGSQAVTEANQIIGRFVAGVRDQYLRLTA
jgi:acetyl esterase/lipase